MSELKPCPFHKRPVLPNLYQGFNDMQGNWARVECPVCGVSIEAEGLGDQAPIAMALWNTRYERTCHIIVKPSDSDYSEDWHFLCSECGCPIGVDEVKRDFVSDATIPVRHAPFCSNCGAKVVKG